MGTLGNRHRVLGVVLAAVVLAAPVVLADESLGLHVETSLTHDDNVTRGHGTGNVLRDEFITVQLGKGLRWPLTSRSRLVISGFAGVNSYRDYAGLTHLYGGVQGDLQFRSSGQFSAPTYALSVRSVLEEYTFSDVRDGYRHAVALSVRKPVTDKLQLFAALSYLVRDGKSAVFDTREASLRGSVDFSLGRWDTLYVGGEYRKGDLVSTGQPAVAFIDLATAIVLDDAFKDTTRYAYRLDGSVWLVNLGYNRALGGGHSLDFSWRMANGTPDDVAGASAAARRIHYTVNQYTLAWLARF